MAHNVIRHILYASKLAHFHSSTLFSLFNWSLEAGASNGMWLSRVLNVLTNVTKRTDELHGY